MTIQQAIEEIRYKAYYNTDDVEMTISKDCYHKIFEMKNENDKLKSKLEVLKDVVEDMAFEIAQHRFPRRYTYEEDAVSILREFGIKDWSGEDE